MDNQPCRFRFAGFEVEPRTGELFRDGTKIPIQEIPFRFLVALLQRPGQLVAREELRAEIWPPDLNLEFEGALDTAARKVRLALGDSSREPTFLETLPGRGYRFIGQLEPDPEPEAGSLDPVGPPQAAGDRPSPTRKVWTAASVLLSLGLLAGLLVWRPWKPKALPYEPRCVAILPFENRTGDASLDSLGQQLADLVRQDLTQAPGVKVARDLPAGPGQGTSLPALAEAVRAQFVASGKIYLEGGELAFNATVTDPWTGKVVYALGPYRGPRTHPDQAIDEMHDRLAGAIARSGTTFQLYRPPRLSAVIILNNGLLSQLSQPQNKIAKLRRALEVDPDFFQARFYLLDHFCDTWDYAQAAEVLAGMDAYKDRATPYEQMWIRFSRAYFENRPFKMLEAIEQLETFFPTQPYVFMFKRAEAEVRVNLPRQAVRDLTLDDSIRNRYRSDAYEGSIYVDQYLCLAYHMAGDYPGELQEAKDAQGVFPDELIFQAHEASALAALGRIPELEKVLEELASVHRGFGPADIEGTRCQAAVELRVHGHPAESRRLAQRVLEELEALPRDRQLELRESRSTLLDLLERWPEALELGRTLAAETKRPIHEQVKYQGHVGSLLVRMGRAEEGRRIEAGLAAMTAPYLFGKAKFYRACIAAQLGEQARAVSLLQQALAEGFRYDDPDFHLNLDLEPLRGYPPFEELMKPKG